MRTITYKNVHKMVTLLLLLHTSFSSATSIHGTITTVTEVAPGFFNYGTALWFSQTQSYTEGGVTFTWPSDFTGTPAVMVSVSSDTYSSSGQVVPIVVDNDASGCTVYVNVATTSAIGEAQTDSFLVHVWAVQDGL